MRPSACLIISLLCLLLPPGGSAADVLPGPIPAQVTRVVDGDTVVVEATIWIGQTVTTHVRLAGIDTPELRGDCPTERLLAQAARDGLADLLDASAVTLHGVRNGAFAGRVVAGIHDSLGRDVAAALLAQGLAQPYDGSGARPSWCAP